MKVDRLENLIGSISLDKLEKSTVLIIGLGGVGGYVVEALTRSNIGNLILVDFDKVDITNFNRQIIAINTNVSKYKVDCFVNRIKEINNKCKVDSYKLKINSENINNIFSKRIDFVVDAIDDVKAKTAIINYCLDHNISFISSMGTGNRLDPSKLIITTLDKTQNDPLAKVMRKKFNDKEKKRIIVCTSLELPIKVKNKKTIGSTSFVPSSAGLLIASYIVKKLIK